MSSNQQQQGQFGNNRIGEQEGEIITNEKGGYNFGSMLSLLEQVQQNYSVQLEPYVMTMSDVICSRPIFANCIPIRHDAIANLFRTLTTQKLSLVVDTDKFVLNILSYTRQLQYRVVGNFDPDTTILHGKYQIHSFNTILNQQDNADTKYQLNMTFNHGLADGECIVLNAGNVGHIERILFQNDMVDRQYTYFVVEDISVMDIFTMVIKTQLLDLISVKIKTHNGYNVYKPNGQLVMRKIIQTNDLGEQLQVDMEPVKDTIMSQTLVDRCGNTVQELLFNYQVLHPTLDITTINTIIHTLSQYRQFYESGIIDTIKHNNLLSQSSYLSTITLLINNNTLTIQYELYTITISAYTQYWHRNIVFDYHGNIIM